MINDLNHYLMDSIDRFKIKNVGHHTASRMPFVMLEDDSIFYGLPTQQASIVENIMGGIINVVRDLEYRYFQTNRRLRQHSQYIYKTGDVVVELGAYLGYYSMYAAKQVGLSGKVIAVEMIPENFAVLQLNLQTNFPDNTLTVNRGVHREKGVRTAYLASNQIAGFRKDVIQKFSPNLQEIDVQMDSVDNILQDCGVDVVDLMIIQVNGNEVDALQGMSKSINSIGNFAIAAPYEREEGNNIGFITDFLTQNGFLVDIDPPWVFAKNACQRKVTFKIRRESNLPAPEDPISISNNL